MTDIEKPLDPDMPEQALRLHMGEMTAQEVRTARAAIRWANTHAANSNPLLVEALTPSAETKAAYSGEFSFPELYWDTIKQQETTRQITVPWTTIKAIMAAIRARALLPAKKEG